MQHLNQQQLASVLQSAAQSRRRRSNLNLHRESSDPVQRFINALCPDSYVRPHRHSEGDRWELFILLEGAVKLLTFDEEGVVTATLTLTPHDNRLVEIPPHTLHTLVALLPSLLCEIKPGPYLPLSDKAFAPWAPAEGAEGSQALCQWYINAAIGDRWQGGC
jgi:cupin fold WbuC family metalloprotein